jgi:hypothetical protein
MYDFLRRVHLFTAFFLLVFVLMYFVTGLVLVHEEWASKTPPKKTSRSEWITFLGEPGSAAFQDYLEERFELRGYRQKPKRHGDGSWTFSWSRPGTGYEVILTPDAKEATLTEIKYPARHVVVGLHRIHGYGHGPIYDVWAFFLDLSSVAVILFALTGIYLWFKTVKKRLAGWICLGIGSVFTAATILHFMWHR